MLGEHMDLPACSIVEAKPTVGAHHRMAQVVMPNMAPRTSNVTGVRGGAAFGFIGTHIDGATFLGGTSSLHMIVRRNAGVV